METWVIMLLSRVVRLLKGCIDCAERLPGVLQAITGGEHLRAGTGCERRQVTDEVWPEFIKNQTQGP
jgi:hypothetical protein